jgi:hypothetical protein
MTTKGRRPIYVYRTVVAAVGFILTISSTIAAQEIAMTVVRPPSPTLGTFRPNLVSCPRIHIHNCHQLRAACLIGRSMSAHGCYDMYAKCIAGCGD